MKTIKAKYFFHLFLSIFFTLSVGCSEKFSSANQHIFKPKAPSETDTKKADTEKADTENKSLGLQTKITLNNFEKEADFTCSEVADRYQFIAGSSSPYIGNKKEYQNFFKANLLDKAITKQVFKQFNRAEILFSEKDIEKILLTKNSNLIEDLLDNNCSWYESFISLYFQKANNVDLWFNENVFSGKLNFVLQNFVNQANADTIKRLEKSLDKKWMKITLNDLISSNEFSKNNLAHIKNFSQLQVFKSISSEYSELIKIFTKYPHKRYTKKVILNEAIAFVKNYNIFKKIKEKKENKYHEYLSVIISSLDAHSHYKKLTKETRGNFSNSMGSAGLGIKITCLKEACLVNKIFKKGPAFGKLQKGDLIISAGSVKKAEVSTHKFITLQLKGKKNTTANLKIIRVIDNKEAILDVSILRGLLQANRFESKLLNNKTAYIRLASFYMSTNGFSSASEDFIAALSALDPKADSLIIDLQDNPGGNLNEASKILASLLVTSDFALINPNNNRWTCGKDSDKKTVESARIPSLFMGEIMLNFKGEKPVYVIPTVTYLQKQEDAYPTLSYYCNRKPYFNHKPIIVLINKNSASASEILSLGLKEAGIALIVGAKNSFGKGSGQTVLNNDSLRITTFLWGSFLGNSIQLTGVESDIVLNFSNKEKSLQTKEGFEKNYPRALPALSGIALPWRKEYAKSVVDYYTHIKKWVKKELVGPLSQLSKERQKIIREKAQQDEVGKKNKTDSIDKTDSIAVKEAINIIKDWQAIICQNSFHSTCKTFEKNWNKPQHFENKYFEGNVLDEAY